MSGRTVFLIGPGFIGGEILELLLQEKYDVKTLIRCQSAATSFHERNIKTVLGTLDDKDIIERQVAASDIVFHTATADHLPSAEAVLSGIRQRSDNGKHTIYIHTSGTSLLGDNSAGSFLIDKVFNDEEPEAIDALADSAHHRKIDLAILRAQETFGDYAKVAIMIPPVVYGVSSRDDRISIQVPIMIRYSIKYGYAGQIGEGRSVWNQIHVKDLARGYMTLLQWLERSPAGQVRSNPYWFCENGEELSWHEIAAEIGRVLHQAGRIDSAEAKTIPQVNYRDLFGEEATEVTLGSNSRCRANRLRKLGWEPREKKALASLVEDEIPLVMKETGPFNGYTKIVPS
ncbi:NAD dependent epimerase/dehydratase family protein [Thelonectria olida]|uniref:NAD dependent epimerase/dehydratase family protein n=1 Tax=Thelonectria olida TaxID=1576542 RepID=A0A9P9AKF2_9HYPO|nr:NAD dependent epimerase/dehydratase family protein [Thelonectria olida]